MKVKSYISDTRARSLQNSTPKRHGYCCQKAAKSLGRPKQNNLSLSKYLFTKRFINVIKIGIFYNWQTYCLLIIIDKFAKSVFSFHYKV